MKRTLKDVRLREYRKAVYQDETEWISCKRFSEPTIKRLRKLEIQNRTIRRRGKYISGLCRAWNDMSLLHKESSRAMRAEARRQIQEQLELLD